MNEELNAAVAEFLGAPANGREPPANYSGDLILAGTVLEALHKRGWFWRLDSVHDGVICTLQNVKRKTYQVKGATMAAAICEAAARIKNE